jgi:RHS repeat-associated protein
MNPAAGLIHFAARDYQPGQAQWLQADPHVGGLAQPQRWNRYGYVVNDPINLVDVAGADPAGPCSQWDNRACGPTSPYGNQYTPQTCIQINGGDAAACNVGATPGGTSYVPPHL